MKPFIWFILPIFLILAGCASGTNPVYQQSMLLAPTGSRTISPPSSREDQPRPWNTYNLVYFPVVSF
jgi:hypothetical protein